MSGFLDRGAAGRALADALVAKNYRDPVVLALPRGGVPIGIETDFMLSFRRKDG